MKLVSYIFPVFNEAENLDVLYARLAKLLNKHDGYRYELIFVNDGSSDDSLAKLLAIQASDPRVSVINFSRNFGHQLAVTAGLDYASGDAVIIMDSDLQDPPTVSFALLKKWEEGFEVVYAQRRARKDTPFKRVTATWFYITLQKFADIDIPRNTGDFRLLDKKVVHRLRDFREHSRFLRGMVSYVGFRQAAVLFDRDERHAGTTSYSLRKMMHFAMDGILGFSTKPLRMITKLGLIISFLSFLGVLYVIYIKLFQPAVAVQGWAFITISILLIGGIQLVTLGVLGSYVGRIYTESQNRPLYIIESIHSKQQKK